MFSSSMFMEDNDLSSGKDNSVDNEFFAKLVDDLFLDNEYFTFPTADNSSSTAATITQSAAATTASSSANSNSSYESSLILSPPASNLSMNSASDSDGSCLSPLSQPDEIVSTPIMAYPAPAPLAIITGMNSNTASSSSISNSQSTISSKRSRDFSDNLFSFDSVASKVFAASANPVKKRKDNEAVAKPVAMSTTSAPKKNFIGVTYHAPSNRFRARIKIDNKTTHLGYFTTEYEAAVAYDRAAYELRGAKAHLNFDQSVIDQSIQFDDNLPIRDRCVAAAKSAAGVVQTAA